MSENSMSQNSIAQSSFSEIPAPHRDSLAFDQHGLLPAIAQEARTGEVLMLGWMNEEALTATLRTGRATYWSRSRGELWRKGDTSGNIQELVDVAVDCDGDAVLLTVHQSGPACHTGQRTCFTGRSLMPGGDAAGQESA